MKKYNFLKSIMPLIIIVFGATLIFHTKQNIANEKKVKKKKAMVTFTDGRVKKKAMTSSEWENAKKDTPVNSGERVRTYKRSRAELELLELDIIRMAPETTIDIVKLYEETKNNVKETKLDLKQGDIWAKLGKKDKTMKFDIATPVAAAAITGTVLRMGVNDDSSTVLKVYTGEVKITNAPEKTDLQPQYIKGVPSEVQGPHEVAGPSEVTMEEWIYIIKKMQKITIGRDGTIKSIGNFKDTDNDEQTDWIKWNLLRDNM